MGLVQGFVRIYLLSRCSLGFKVCRLEKPPEKWKKKKAEEQNSGEAKKQKSTKKRDGTKLVGGLKPSEKYESIGIIVLNIWKNKNVPNHQPVNSLLGGDSLYVWSLSPRFAANPEVTWIFDPPSHGWTSGQEDI